MTHQRKNIRDAVVQLLTAAGVAPAGRVFSNRLTQVAAEDLPVVNVYVTEETSRQAHTASPDASRRTLKVSVVGVVAASDETSVDDDLDALAEKIEAALGASPTFAGTVDLATLTATTLEGDASGEVAVGRVSLDYTAEYFTT